MCEAIENKIKINVIYLPLILRKINETNKESIRVFQKERLQLLTKISNFFVLTILWYFKLSRSSKGEENQK